MRDIAALFPGASSQSTFATLSKLQELQLVERYKEGEPGCYKHRLTEKDRQIALEWGIVYHPESIDSEPESEPEREENTLNQVNLTVDDVFDYVFRLKQERDTFSKSFQIPRVSNR